MNHHRTLLAFLFAAGCAADPADDAVLEPDAGTEDEDTWSEIAISAPDHVRLPVTVPTTLAVSITRDGEAAQGDVSIAIAGLPAGVTAEPITIAAGETSGTLTLTATAAATLAAPAPITIVATAADLESKAASAITVVGLPGMYDPTFGDAGRAVISLEDGHDEHLRRVIATPDGGFVAVGHDTSNPTRIALFWYDAAGALVRTSSLGHGFGTVVDAALDAEGRIIVLTEGVNGAFVSRIRADGFQDETFNKGGSLIGGESCSGVAVDAQGRVYVGCGTNGAEAELLRFGADGILDSSFDLDGRAPAGAMTQTVQVAIDGQDRPIMLGTITATPVAQSLWRFAEDGHLDVTRSLDGEWGWAHVHDLVHAGGRTYAAFTGVWSSMIVAVGADGLDPAFGGGGIAEIEDLYFARISDDGAGGLVVVGSRETVAGGYLVHLDAGGLPAEMASPDHAAIDFAAGTAQYYTDVAVTPDGRATVVGIASSDFALARLWL